ncbi:erythromycin esterase family protein [Actinokineospora sp. NBRC 105648]|uniref:erythromycin esterase family protein n=1 Tax=Actinokineospora sp. NBRC 105648 TaxID=3032206 RepID=UPI0024A1FEA5|nr:erythromycin esterase family protein [Actinokineospora sp. NBRC 105648]GLZ37207.1 erythromycin esterase [Actinokineospora sp. NBRC 105648]
MAVDQLSERAVTRLRTLEPADPLDDLDWLGAAIGDARVVAIGESAHYNRESYQLRHRLLRYLVERHGFGAYAVESGFVEGVQVDRWIQGGADELGRVMAEGMTSLMGLWTPMGEHLRWMRQHHETPRLYGIDTPGSNASLLPGIDAVYAYLARADPGFVPDPAIRETAAAFAASSAFAIPATFAAYGDLPVGARNALTAGLADLTARMTAHRTDYPRRATGYDRALQSLHLTVALDAVFRELARGDQRAMMLTREAAIADTVDWILRREDRVVLAAHNGHLHRGPVAMPGLAPAATAGTHLADRLGADYLVIGTTTGTGQTLSTDFFGGTLFEEMDVPRPGSLDALMAASCHDGPFATDLRTLSPADLSAVRAVAHQRFGTFYVESNAADAYDLIIHLPRVTAAEPDRAALEHSPRDVREAFARWGA